jgi:glycosyltransferase involved in cell wall biosynthesis
MRVALVHDWLTGLRGGEKCLLAFLELYPDAHVHTLIHIPGTTSEVIDKAVRSTSWLNRLPFRSKIYRLMLPFFPSAVRSLRLEDYDLIISLSHAAAKNVTVPKGAVHVCYCFTPMRYIWDQVRSYFGPLSFLLWPVVTYLRRWDVEGAKNVHHFVAISRFIGARIRCFYGRKSKVIFPPVDTSWLPVVPETKLGEAFLYAGALVPYKRPDLVVEAFNRLGLPLWVLGSGPLEQSIRTLAKPNVTVLGRLSDAELAGYFQRCRALIFPGKEDFGMIPVECLASGRPVIGLGAGGLAETLKGFDYRTMLDDTRDAQDVCGVFIPPHEEGNLDALVAAIKVFIEHEQQFSQSACTRRAELFSVDRFKLSWNQFLSGAGLERMLPAGEHHSSIHYKVAEQC